MRYLVTTLLFLTFLNHIYAQRSPMLVPYRIGDKWGFSDTSGKVILQAVYDYANAFSDYKNISAARQLAIVQQDGNMFSIDRNGNRNAAAGLDYREYAVIENKIFEIVVDSKYKYKIFANGKQVTTVDYDGISAYDSIIRAFAVWKDHKTGVIGTDGKIIVPVKFEDLGVNCKKSTRARIVWDAYIKISEKKEEVKSVLFTQINKSGKLPELCPTQTEMLVEETAYEKTTESKLKEKTGVDKLRILKEKKLAVIEKDGKQGILLYDSLFFYFKSHYKINSYSSVMPGNCAQGNAAANKAYIIIEDKGKFGIINEKEEMVLPAEYDGISKEYEFYFPEHYFLLRKENKEGVFILTGTGKLVAPKYEKLIGTSSFSKSGNCLFLLFHFKTEKGSGYVGENGFEYYKDE